MCKFPPRRGAPYLLILTIMIMMHAMNAISNANASNTSRASTSTLVQYLASELCL
jgi:hypothetical protein